MSVHPTQLEERASGRSLDAELHDSLPIDALFEAEELWAAERVRVLRDCLRADVKYEDQPESVHWSWAQKAVRAPWFSLGGLSPYRLFGMKAEGVWQGLLIGCCLGHVSKIAPGGRDLVYVDFLEAAPWNWKLPAAGRAGRLKGVGRQLFELAVRWSDDLGFKGRVGLHALPQAEDFYRGSCAMTDLGTDLSYKPPLRYFEFSEAQARTILGDTDHDD